uniref:DDE Tnp4 domain-containing protein n=1 Tax=Anopheles albimanus TaxID=7167 RepID=A0A182F482_ANOAL
MMVGWMAVLLYRKMKATEQVTKEILSTLYCWELASQPVAMCDKAATDFLNLWGFPNCVGSIDGKHMKIVCPRTHRKNALPAPKALPAKIAATPLILVGDEGFALASYMMRPYARASLGADPRKKLFNSSLSRARRVVENAFGIMAMKWQNFGRAIHCKEETIDTIIQAACCLNNFILQEKKNN